MQFKNIFTLALFGVALASPAAHVRRQDSTQLIKSQLDAVKEKVDALDAAVKALKAGDDKAAVSGLDKLSTTVETAIKDATAKITAITGPPISAENAIKIQLSSSALGDLTKATVNDLIAKKDIIKAAGQLPNIQQHLTTQQAAAKGLSAAIVTKLATEVQTLAQTLSAGIAADLERGAKAFAS